MELFITIILLAILAETTYLTAVNTQVLSKKIKRSIFVDTSALIDGRIVAVAQSGFIDGTLQIPRSVVAELQFLADNSDPEKRSRARHGLDVIADLQQVSSVDVEIYRDDSRASEGVDERLLSLARKHKGSAICTVDYNLNKVAQVEQITVLNVNDLSMTLRMAHLPGEHISVELTQKGQDSHQAVGHLADGTMVVVENASGLIGQVAEVEVIRSLQTAAGRMMFAKLVKNEQSKGGNNQRKHKTNSFSKRRTVQRSSSKQRNDSKPKPRTSAQREADLIELANKD
jgi:uncharacterized protein YacL